MRMIATASHGRATMWSADTIMSGRVRDVPFSASFAYAAESCGNAGDHRGDPDEAIEHLRAATVADPYFALPYYYTGQASELAHDTVASLMAYRAFLAHASRADNLRPSAEEALARLGRPVK
jgi:predicted Zn-dependent protease